MTAPPRRPPPRREVRIVGGMWKRSRLPVVDAPGLRPTPDRVRETVFNWLGQDLAGWRVVDAWAGTGALGFEAASRGAADVVLVEREPRVVARLQETRVRLKAEAIVRVERSDALAWLRRAPRASFDLVFVDPPYDAGSIAPAIAAAAEAVVAGGWIYAEAGEPLATSIDPRLSLVRSGRAGAVCFHLLRRVEMPSVESED